VKGVAGSLQPLIKIPLGGQDLFDLAVCFIEKAGFIGEETLWMRHRQRTLELGRLQKKKRVWPSFED
jgi:hypothetical protein